MTPGPPSAPDADLPPLPSQPDGVAWPTRDWPEGDPVGADTDRLAGLLGSAFAAEPPEELGLTRALVVVQAGRVVVESYGPGFHSAFDEAAGRRPEPDGPDTTLISWSMAKSMLAVALGIAARHLDLDLDTRAPVPEWDDPADPRHAITWRHLLTMTPGLAWNEEYSPDAESDVIGMLFGDGATDMAAHAASFPLTDPPGTRFRYSSGTTNILARALQHRLGLAGDAEGMRRWLAEHLFDPIGMATASPKFDEAGTWVASSYVYATARDFARFGLLALRGGVWDGERLLDTSWVDTLRRPIGLATDHPYRYGGHWWIRDDGLGSFVANGYEEQRIICVPRRDLVVVRLGKTPHDPTDPTDRPRPVDRHLDRIIDCFPP